MASRTLIALLAVAAAAGCTREEADFPSQEELYESNGGQVEEEEASETAAYLRAGGRFLYVEASPDNLLGPEINVDRTTSPDDRGLRGRAYDLPVNLSFDEGRVRGIAGTSPFNLDVRRENGALVAEGLIYGQLADLRLDEEKLTAQIGACGFDLSRSPRSPYYYVGMAACGRPVTQAIVRLPAELLRWDDPDLVAALGLLLSGLSTAP